MTPQPALDSHKVAAAARGLYEYLRNAHWDAPVLSGPDPGVRWNARIGRFVKSYTAFLPWRDSMVYTQAQKYWIQANLLVADQVGTSDANDVAVQTARYLQGAQTPEGYWEYPNPEWAGRIATVEGNYAAIGMLLAAPRAEETVKADLISSSVRWYDYSVESIGFQEVEDTLAINYFGNVSAGRIPNNTASSLRVFAMLADATGSDRFLEYCAALMRFMLASQAPSGELPYATPTRGSQGRPHFLCHQYNAFQFLNIADYWVRTGDPQAETLLERLVPFLVDGVTETGSARYDCSSERPEVVYYGAALGSALNEATRLGLGDHQHLGDRCIARLLEHQQPDGSFPYSLGNHRVLNDKRRYPRYLSMILTFLLVDQAQRAAHERAAAAEMPGPEELL